MIAHRAEADAAAYGDWIVNALHGEDAMATLVPLDFAGKLLVDIGKRPQDGPRLSPG